MRRGAPVGASRRIYMKFFHLSLALCTLVLVAVAVPHVARAQASDLQAEAMPAAGSPFRSIEELARRVADVPGDFQARRQYADALYDAGRFREAADQYELYLQGMQGGPESVHRYLIALASYAGDNARGERVSERYIAFFPTDSDLHMRLGYFRLWQGKYDQAVAAFEQALRLAPENAEARRGLQETQQNRVLSQRLATPPPVRAMNPADQPLLDEQRYRYIEELIAYRRFADAYDQLMLLAERHTETQRWLAMYETVDRGLVASVGATPAYPVDRFTFLLQQHPYDVSLRYQLVDALADAGRVAEAYDVLLDQNYVTPRDSGYVQRLAMLETMRATLEAGYMARLEARFANESNDRDVLRELIDAFIAQRRSDEALSLYERVLNAYPDDDATRLDYASLLMQNGLFPEAFQQVDAVLARDATDEQARLLYARMEIASGQISDRSGQYLDAHVARYPDDADVLLDQAARLLALGDPEAADRKLRRAFSVGVPSDRNRIYIIDAQIERALLREKRDDEAQALREARFLASVGNVEAAVAAYERYFQLAGRRPRALLIEMADLYGAAGQYGPAIGILESLQAHTYSYALARSIARYRYFMEDRSGAILVLEDMVARNPRDMEARDLLAQIYLEARRFRDADSVYHDHVDALVQFSRLEPVAEERLNQRIMLVEHLLDTDYVGLVVPVSQYIAARGRITRYEHWAQGLLTQVTMPREPHPFVLTAGLISHFQNGTRRLLPNSGRALERINQVMAGAIFNLADPEEEARRRLVSRLNVSVGLFDYAGGRTTGFAEAYYLNRVPDRYMVSLSARSTEAATVMWSPAGGQFGLRLTQFEAVGRTYFLDEARLRVQGGIALNLVNGRADSTLTGVENNAGTDLRIETSLRVRNYTRFGLSFNNINYRDVLETYFSPQDYRAYDMWVEYERELAVDWYIRARATAGIVSYRRDALAGRGEADLIYRLADQLSVSLSASLGHSVRFLEGSGILRDDRYRMAVFSGSLYWTL